MLRQLIILLLFCSLGCKKTDSSTELVFDKTRWNTKNGEDFLYRDRMLDDLIDHHKLKGMNRAQVLDFLGDPTKIDTNYLFYRINEKRIKFLTLHTKTLVIEFAKDSLVNRVLIHQ